MFGVGFFEIVIIGVFALIFVGPKRLPDVMKQAGRLFVHIRRTTNDVRSTFDQVVREAENEIRREEADALRQALQPVQDAHSQMKRMLTPELTGHMIDARIPAPPEPPPALVETAVPSPAPAESPAATTSVEAAGAPSSPPSAAAATAPAGETPPQKAPV